MSGSTSEAWLFLQMLGLESPVEQARGSDYLESPTALEESVLPEGLHRMTVAPDAS